MSLELKYIGSEILRKKCRPVEVFDDTLKATLDEMVEILYEAGGVGLAAPQVGLSADFFIIIANIEDDEREEDEIVFMANVEILETSSKEIDFEEGCLSVPGFRAEIKRPEEIRIAFDDIDGERHELEVGGYPARVIQHEHDHCRGVLFVDRLSTIKRSLLRREIEAIEEKYSPKRG
ncbi:MAG: peptide deformylase [bacterium]|nr:peptide deformylase [bacterium]